MRILFFLRLDAGQVPGGDAVEAGALTSALRARGHEVEVVSSLSPAEGDCDLVHLFNIDRAAELGAFLDANRGCPNASVVLSPLFSWTSHDTGAGPSGFRGGVSRAMRSGRSVANLARASARPRRQWLPGAAVMQLAARTDGLVFHTAAEEHAFRRSYPAFRRPSAVIAPPLDVAAADPALAAEVQSLRPYVACVGRIEPLKNQRWLLRSGMTSHFNLIFAGPINPKRRLYGAHFRRDIGRSGRARYLGAVDRAGVTALLENAFAHVLPSSAENFGLATLEALAAGCEAIIPGGHPAATVLEASVHRFDLRNPASAVARVQAVNSGERRAHRFAREDFDPASVASRLLAFYDEVRAAPDPRRAAWERIGRE
jgi:glycosyltransferase involved in cell wall biosynthesis